MYHSTVKLIQLRFYAPPTQAKGHFERRSSQTISWLSSEKLKSTTKPNMHP